MHRTLASIVLRFLVTAFSVVAFFLSAPSANADDLSRSWGIDEFRFGALAHQIEDSPGEGGVDVNLELLFDKLHHSTGSRLLDYFLSPRPMIGASINTQGDTSQLYAGVTWDLKLTDRIFFETSFGGALHDGHLDEDGETQYGCRANFRESAALGFNLSEQWDVILTIDHMSNAGLCEENRGLTNAGVKFGYKW